jgi:hypothetical protein
VVGLEMGAVSPAVPAVALAGACVVSAATRWLAAVVVLDVWGVRTGTLGAEGSDTAFARAGARLFAGPAVLCALPSSHGRRSRTALGVAGRAGEFAGVSPAVWRASPGTVAEELTIAGALLLGAFAGCEPDAGDGVFPVGGDGWVVGA